MEFTPLEAGQITQMDERKCPICEVEAPGGVCPKCGLGIPRGISSDRWFNRGTDGRDRLEGVGSFYEHARYKEDH